MNNKGLAQTEIFVIIAVIFLLGVFLFSSLKDARKNAQKTGCTGNLKCIGTAIAQYTDKSFFGVIPDGDGVPVTSSMLSVVDMAVIWDNGKGLWSEDKTFMCPLNYKNLTKASATGGAPGSVNSGFMDNVNNISYGLTNLYDLTDKPSKIIVADIAGKGSKASDNHDAYPNEGDQTCLFVDTHVKLYKTANPSDDADLNGIYSGVHGTGGHETIIY